VLVAPADLVIEAKARSGGTVCIELDAFGTRHVVAQVLREGHFYPGDQIDDHPHLLALGCLHRGHEREEESTGDGDSLECLKGTSKNTGI